MGRFLYLLLSITLLSNSGPVRADAIMVNEAMRASSIAQYFIDEHGVRVELEIGANAVPAFRNLMPDAIYNELSNEPIPIEERLRTFFEQDLSLRVEAGPLPGYVEEMGPAYRVLRDPVNGTPLPVQEDAPRIIKARLYYPFPEGELPQALGFTAPYNVDIGFVAYHKGVAINDFRYLAPGYLLTLDWTDPWYSAFNARQLMRQYSAPMSGFIYVENFEVRKEIIARPKDMQRYVDLGLEERSDIPVEMQDEVKRKVGEFLAEHQPITINGEPTTGILDRVNFLERTLNSSRVVDPPQTLELDSAILGAIFIYPRTELPQEVVMTWDLWDERIQRIPVSAVDQAGPLPSYLEPDWPELKWTNFLKHPDIPTLQVVESPVSEWQVRVSQLLPLLAFGALVCFGLIIVQRRAQKGVAAPALLGLVFLVGTVGAYLYGRDNRPEEARATAIVGDLLNNIYRAFDYREESDIYDMLAHSVSGELLTDIFLETKRSLVLANQGGAEAKVKDIEVTSLELQPGGEQGSFTVEADWTVHGSVGHWGHVHQRSNRYLAKLGVAVDGDQWKLQDMNVLQQERR